MGTILVGKWKIICYFGVLRTNAPCMRRDFRVTATQLTVTKDRMSCHYPYVDTLPVRYTFGDVSV